MHTINVTKSFLPPLEEYQAYIKQIWANEQLTNQGLLLHEFEQKTSILLNVSNFHFVGNGTIALQVALRALDINGGEVITTPFSYVATTSAILWENCKPVFVDIEPDTFCIDPNKIEAAITDKTKAIMPVHVFGNPCDVEMINKIAKKHKLKVIYDAAHAFGVEYNGKSLLNYGDISTCSFHATKVFHTIEGGCIIANSKEVSDKVELIKRFGHNGDDHYRLGINAKASEFQAAMGLCNLKYIELIIQKRQKLSQLYDNLLGNNFHISSIKKNIKQNYAYYPLLFRNETKLLKTLKALNDQSIYPRRYFYPSLNTLSYLENQQICPISEKISKQILCLPLYAELPPKDVKNICKIVKHSNE